MTKAYIDWTEYYILSCDREGYEGCKMTDVPEELIEEYEKAAEALMKASRKLKPYYSGE